MNTLRGSSRGRKQVRIGAPDPSLTGSAGLLAVHELVERVGLVAALDAAVPGFKSRRRGCSPGEFALALAAAQLTGADHLVGLDHRRQDAVAESFTGCPTPASSSVTALARRLEGPQWAALTAATAPVTARVLAMSSPRARRALRGPVTIDLDATDIEVYGKRKQAVTYNYQGQLSGRVHAATWAEAGLLTAARLTDSRTTPHTTVVDLVTEAMSWLDTAGVTGPGRARPRVRADIGYCSKTTAAAVVAAGADFAVGQQRQPKIWLLLDRIDPNAWTPAIDMRNAETTALDYPYPGWPPGTRLIVRRVTHRADTISADPRARRRRTLAPGQLALALTASIETIYSYSFILTNLETTTPALAREVEHWHRHRTDIEELFKQAKHGAALRHLPSGDHAVNTAWVMAAFLAVTITRWLHLLLDHTAHIGITRWRRELINTPGRLVTHARARTLRCPPGAILPAVLARIRALPTPA